MPLQLETVTEERDFDEILPMLHEAFEQPHNALHPWFMPIHTTVEGALADTKERTIKRWNQGANTCWLKVTDTDSGRIVGAAEWATRNQDQVASYRDPQKPIDAYWHIEGSEERVFAGRLLTLLSRFVKDRMARPHLELAQLVVHVDHRRQGIGRLLLDWGKRKADSLGLESCVEAVPSSVPFYEAMGYGKMDVLVPDMSKEDPSAQWQKWASEDLRVFLLWRPAGHDYQADKDVAPWL
ncbi:hypothetical protein F5Y17DRAFT_195013 [Xylariaceae sp. FL0594]|nr:hypothetical protein F5Y17DRAFT_195013 [Xylariaceae sp. FL0594]